MKKILALIGFALLLATQVHGVSYRTDWARYIFADICLGAPVGFYEKFAAEGDANSSRAMRWYKQGIHGTNQEMFDRIELEKNVSRIVLKGSRHVITGKEVELSTDGLYNENNVRVILADIALGAELASYKIQVNNPDVVETFERLSDSVSVTNLYQMERILIGNKWTVVKKGTLIPIAGQCIKLDIDEGFYQPEARYMFADMCLGGPVSYYRESGRLSRDPNIAGALQMFDDSVKILNLWQFERKTYPGNQCKIVFKGTDTRIDGSFVQLSTDRIGDAEVRYKMVDIGLGAPIGFYRADAKNATNIIMFSHFDNGVRVMNLCDFERNRFSDLGMIDALKGTKHQIAGEEVVLSSDIEYSEAPVRKIMAEVALGANYDAYSAYPASFWAAIAHERIAEGVKITNLKSFEKKGITGKGTVLVYAGSDKPADGSEIILNTDHIYNELQVRELIVMNLIQNQSATQSNDPDSREASKRIKNGVTVTDLNQYQLNNGILCYKASVVKLNPEEIELSTDMVEDIYKVKEMMLEVELGLLKKSELKKDKNNLLAQQAYNKIKAGEKVSNLNTFEVKKLKGRGALLVYKGTEKPIKAYDITLSTDHEWSEGQARFIMADMALGGPVGFYEECNKNGDPIAAEPYSRWMKGVRVVNADKFERKFVPRIGWKIVYKGSYSIINPMDVKLTTD
jgi:hypothetical protein